MNMENICTKMTIGIPVPNFLFLITRQKLTRGRGWKETSVGIPLAMNVPGATRSPKVLVGRTATSRNVEASLRKLLAWKAMA